MHDAVGLEERGTPTAVIVTSAFVGEVEVLSAALGVATLSPVVISHPLSTLSESEIHARAEEAVSSLPPVLTVS